MLTDEKIKSFVEFYYPDSESTREKASNVLKLVEKYEKEFGYGVEEFSIDNLSYMFTDCGWLNKTSSFGVNRSYIKAYVQNVCKVGAAIEDFKVDDIDSYAIYRAKYFSSVQDFVDFINSVFSIEYQIRMKAICVMYWIGLSPKEVSEIKISDVNFDERTVLGRKDVDPMLLDILNKCYMASEYEAPMGNGVRMMQVMDGENIIRKTSGGSKINNESNVGIRAINALTDRMKNSVEEARRKKHIDQKCLAANGKYVKVYEYQIKHPEEAIDQTKHQKELENLLGEKFSSTATYTRFLLRYKEWRMCYYNF